MYEQLKGPSGVSTGHAAVDKIGEHKLCATPQNYEIWLNYISGWAPDLTREVDSILSKGYPLTDVELEKIHNKFFAATQLSSQVMETGTKIAKEIADAVEALKSASATTEEYGATLDDAAKSLTRSDITNESLGRIVSVLSESTKEMSDLNQDLNVRLVSSTQEIETLRASLQAARAEALTDGLTGVANRKQFDEVIKRRVAESLDDGSDLCVIICDIDFFKKFNDTWGHQTGDQVIRFVANSLSQKAVNDALVARYGGEEFAIVLPRTNLDTALELAESVRKTIESKKLIRRSTGEPLGQVTVSFGIAQFRSGEDIVSLVERADSCLYHSKQNGRNRVTLESDPSLR